MSLHYSNNLEKQIASHFILVLDESLLELAQTEKQKEAWHILDRSNRLISICWMSKLCDVSPPWEELEKRILKGWMKDLIWARVNELQNLWKLIEYTEPFIQEKYTQKGETYPFNNAVQLFNQIVATEANNSFRVCLKPYHHVSIQDTSKFLKLAQRLLSQEKLKPHEEQFWKNQLSQYEPNIWFRFVIKFIHFEKKEKQQKLFKNYVQALYQRIDLEYWGRQQKRSSKNLKKFTSFTWYHGEKILANQHGGTYSLKSESSKNQRKQH